MSKLAPPTDSDAHTMDDVRSLIIGGDEKFVENIVRRNAKDMVSQVVSEALSDRENHDGSVNKVLVPLVEKSLHRSVEANSDKIVGALYPLVGSLIRKAVSAFLIEFIERTNTLIENSFSLKSIKWRLNARRAGIRYSDYVASQIYQYQVHQVFVIHRETGTLLNSVATDPSAAKDGDLVSSMLVAMNDFVADAFTQESHHEDTELGEIKTDDFTLLIKVGPQVILVAAVTGNVPPQVRNKLQDTLEDFHRYYQLPLLSYNGDNGAFVTSDALLQECLVSEQKVPEKKKRRLGFGALPLACITVGLGYLAFLRIELSITASKIDQQAAPAGIVVLDTRIDGGHVLLSVLRDPAAPQTQRWLSALNVDPHQIVVHETPFVSQDERLTFEKIQRLVAAFPSLTFTNSDRPALTGQVGLETWQRFQRRYNAIPAIQDFEVDTTGVVISDMTSVEDSDVLTSLAQSLATRLSGYALYFDMNQTLWSKTNDATIGDIAQTLLSLQNIAQQSGQRLDVFILGGSDNSGTATKNLLLSESRAVSVKTALIDAGVPDSVLHTKGLGQLDFARESNSRVVFFHALLTKNVAQTKTAQEVKEGNRQ